MRSLLLLGVVAGCGSDAYLVITVVAPPAVHDVAQLDITRFGEEPPQVETLPTLNFTFPVTFSISGVGQSGTVDLAINAVTASKFVVGTARAQIPLDVSDAVVRLDTTDFVVNTDFEADQFLAQEPESVGGQITSTTQSDWTVTFGTTCTQCNFFGRRFSAAGVPLFSADAGGTEAFRVSAKPTAPRTSSPVIASAGLNSIVVWDYTDTTPDGARGVACRGIDDRGNATAGQLPVTFETADGADAAPLPNGNFAVTWFGQVTKLVHMRTMRPDCSPVTDAIAISQPETEETRDAHVASNGDALLYGWILGESARLRGGTAGGMLGMEFQIDPPVDSSVEHVRVAPMGSGFAIALRIAATNRSMPGSILLYRASASGELLPGAPTVITDQSGSNTSTGRIGFGIATRRDGATMIVWHQCDDGGSAACLNRLDVYGRVVNAEGAPVGEPFVIPTTTEGDQESPSVTALDGAFVVTWIDSSMASPDTDGSAVRARIIYPPF